MRQDAKVAALEKAGHAVLRIVDGRHLRSGAEFFRWEIATAVAGSIIGINAFNQPDVEASKIATRNLTSEYEKTGSLPAEKPVLEDDGIKLFTDEKNAADLARAAGADKSLAGYLKAHLSRISAGDYFAVLGYIQMNAEHERKLAGYAARGARQETRRTCLGFGPRFLHSTGQAYKGGPNSGVFLQITCDDAAGSAGAATEIHLRHCQGGAGARRLPSAGRARAAALAGASGAMWTRSVTLAAAVQKALR